MEFQGLSSLLLQVLLNARQLMEKAEFVEIAKVDEIPAGKMKHVEAKNLSFSVFFAKFFTFI
jgi:hypothetical protein